MHQTLAMMRRWLYLLVVLGAGICLLFPAVQRSGWHRNQLYAQLLSGTPEEQLSAASTLAYLRDEEHLLKALQSENHSARELGQRALEHVWFTSSGTEAYEVSEIAYQAARNKELHKALTLLTGLLHKYPRFAEGWNRRASVYWQLGQFEKSKADSEKAVMLNPNHYGAWQGLGICHLQQGDLLEACRCLRAAQKLLPHDPATRGALQKCEQLLRAYPLPSKHQKPADIV